MARMVISKITTPLYDKDGRHVADRTDEYVVDKRDGRRHQVQDPARPQGECYPCPDVGRLVVEHQAARAAGQAPVPPLTPARPTVNHLACKTCQQVRCRCGVPAPPTGEQMLAWQKSQGRR